MGVEPNHTTAGKPGPLQIIQSLWQILYAASKEYKDQIGRAICHIAARGLGIIGVELTAKKTWSSWLFLFDVSYL